MERQDFGACDGCQRDKASAPLNFCNACGCSFCDDCWDEQVPHRRQKPGHEKTDGEIAQKVRNILSPSKDTALQEELFREDSCTAWFGVDRNNDGRPLIFRDYGRYAELLNTTSRERQAQQDQGSFESSMFQPRDTRTPSLVSFVGQTGAGKSTVIKLLIEFNGCATKTFPGPVVGAAGADVPSSEDVHLYLDPSFSLEDTPILYADCEGLEGGEREPLGARFKRIRREEGASSGQAQGGASGRYSSERELVWAKSSETRSREYVVAQLYPRLLYTFSDVIVFVLRNPRVLEGVFQKLIEWAAAALEKSSNQPILPHAIVVLNASPQDIDPDQWDFETATKTLLQNLKDTVYRNPVMQRYAQFWRDRDRQVNTVEDLLLAYYSSLQVVRIPTDKRPSLMKNQIICLYHCIRWACAAARDRKETHRMLLDAQELQSYLQFAFDHYAKTLSFPFDFVEASLSNSPHPLGFGGNILKLAIMLKDAKNPHLDAQVIFSRLSLLVASCIMLDSVRHRIIGTADHIFPSYLDHLHTAISNFSERHWPCEFVASDGSKCVNVRSGHSKGHQLKNGTVFAVGDYYAKFSLENSDEFYNTVYFDLEAILERLRQFVRGGQSQDVAAAEIHRDTVMARFYTDPSAFRSHTTCLCCLIEPPDHVLPCGHIFCESCILSYGHTRSRVLVELEECPIHRRDSRRGFPHTVYLKPKTAGVRILALDGGGIRGIIQLEMLRMIEKTFRGRMPIQCLFDLVIGEGCSGVIALGLATRQWSCGECIEVFEKICSQAFTKRIGGNIPGLSWLVEGYKSKYQTRPLEGALINAFSSKMPLFGGRSSRQNSGFDYGIKVGVVTTSDYNRTILLTNYNRQSGQNLPYQFCRPENRDAEFKVWEAARATSATLGLFKPFRHEPTNQTYVNDPFSVDLITVASLEWEAIWPQANQEYPDILLSLGIGFDPTKAMSNWVGIDPPRGRIGRLMRDSSFISQHMKWMQAINAANQAQKSHEALINARHTAWDTYLSQLRDKAIPRFFRLDPEVAKDLPSIDDYESLRPLRKEIRKYSNVEIHIQRIACTLAASLFYFELSEPITERAEGGFLAKGSIFCRLPPTSPEIRELGIFIQEHSRTEAHFLVRDATSRWMQRVILDAELVDMIRDQQFTLGSQTILMSSKNSLTEILLCLNFRVIDFNEEAEYPISGFPRSLFDDSGRGPMKRHIVVGNSDRLASRPDSRVKNWSPPDPRLVSNTSTFSSPEPSSSLSGNNFESAKPRHGQTSHSFSMPVAEMSSEREPAELNAESPRSRQLRDPFGGEGLARRNMKTTSGNEQAIPSSVRDSQPDWPHSTATLKTIPKKSSLPSDAVRNMQSQPTAAAQAGGGRTSASAPTSRLAEGANQGQRVPEAASVASAAKQRSKPQSEGYSDLHDDLSEEEIKIEIYCAVLHDLKALGSFSRSRVQDEVCVFLRQRPDMITIFQPIMVLPKSLSSKTLCQWLRAPTVSSPYLKALQVICIAGLEHLVRIKLEKRSALLEPALKESITGALNSLLDEEENKTQPEIALYRRVLRILGNRGVYSQMKIKMEIMAYYKVDPESWSVLSPVVETRMISKRNASHRSVDSRKTLQWYYRLLHLVCKSCELPNSRNIILDAIREAFLANPSTSTYKIVSRMCDEYSLPGMFHGYEYMEEADFDIAASIYAILLRKLSSTGVLAVNTILHEFTTVLGPTHPLNAQAKVRRYLEGGRDDWIAECTSKPEKFNLLYAIHKVFASMCFHAPTNLSYEISKAFETECEERCTWTTVMVYREFKESQRLFASRSQV